MAEEKHSDVWSFFSSPNGNNKVCDVCGKTARICGNTTNLVKHLRINHNTEYDEVMLMRRSGEGHVLLGMSTRLKFLC